MLTTLSDAASKYILYYGRMHGGVGISAASIAEVGRKTINVLYNRLFIGPEIEDLKIMARWRDATAELAKSSNPVEFRDELDRIMNDIKTAAMRDFS